MNALFFLDLLTEFCTFVSNLQNKFLFSFIPVPVLVQIRYFDHSTGTDTDFCPIRDSDDFISFNKSCTFSSLDLSFRGQIKLFVVSCLLFLMDFFVEITMEARDYGCEEKASPLFSPRLFLRVEDRGRKRCPCLNEAKIGSRVALQRNRQIIPTPRVDVCVCACACACV